MARRVEVDLPSTFSDGNSSKWPQGDYIWTPDDTMYQEKLADLGKDLIKESRDGQKYIFRELPSGYRIYIKARKDGRVDRYIFGHPNARFDSPIKFFVHFKWMMQNGKGDCHCVNCKTQGMRNAISQSTTAATTNATAIMPVKLDPYSLSAQLERFIKILGEGAQDLTELIVPWEAPSLHGCNELLNGQSFKDLVAKYQTRPSFLPRKGELVMFYAEGKLHCGFEEGTQQFKYMDEHSKGSAKFPCWKAGVIAAEPEIRLGHEELSPPSRKRLDTVDKFYRIELYPDPSGRNKDLSQEAHLVPLHRIRPLSTYHEFLSGIHQDQWHETIKNALKVTNTLAVVDPVEFVGTRTSYSIRYRGLWIGPELFVIGDAVRLLSSQQSEDQVDQAMIIHRIIQRFKNNKESSIIVAGCVITINKERSFQESPFLAEADQEEKLLPSSTAGYPWYPIDALTGVSPGKNNPKALLSSWYEIPVSYIVGRLYDANAMKILFDIGGLDIGALGVQRARRWARHRGSTRNVNDDQAWNLVVDRIEALDLYGLNGQAVGRGAEHKQSRRGCGDGSSTSHRVPSFGRRQAKRENLGIDSSARSSTFMDPWPGSEDGDEDKFLEKAMGSHRPSDTDGRSHSNHNESSPQSVKSIVTDRTINWSKAEDESAQTFISEVIAGGVLPQAMGDEDEDKEKDSTSDDQGGIPNEDSLERHRPAKRPRL